jgi:hypothetical protein
MTSRRGEQGLPPRGSASIAPAAPHAQHMPSHIFTRVGSWQESIDSNRASARAAQEALRENTIGLRSYESLHAYDYMMYAYMQLAKDREARALMEEVTATRKLNVDHFAGAFALAAIPARFTLERGQWAEAAALTPTPADLGWDKFPQAESIVWFARGIGAARSGNVADAKKSLARIEGPRHPDRRQEHVLGGAERHPASRGGGLDRAGRGQERGSGRAHAAGRRP